MQSHQTTARLVISIELRCETPDAETPIFNVASHRRLRESTASLVKLLDRYRTPATWALSDSAGYDATDVVRDAKAPHEIAVLGESSWIGPQVERSRFAKELERRVERVRGLGISVSTLALSDRVELPDHLDLLTKRSISMVCQASPNRSTSRSTSASTDPRMLRFGVWLSQASYQLTGRSRWPLGLDSLLPIRRLICRAVATGSTFHLAIDGIDLLATNEAGLQLVERVLKFADRQRQAKLIESKTLAQLAESLSLPRQSAPARSVLREAA